MLTFRSVLKKSVYFSFALLLPSSTDALSLTVEKAWYGNMKNKNDVTHIIRKLVSENPKACTIPANMNALFNKPTNGEKRALHLTMKSEAIDCSVMLTPGTSYTIDETFIKHAEKRQTLAKEIDSLSQQLRQNKPHEEHSSIRSKLELLSAEKKHIEELLEPWRVQATAVLASQKPSMKKTAKKLAQSKTSKNTGKHHRRVAVRGKKDMVGMKKKFNKTKTPLKAKLT